MSQRRVVVTGMGTVNPLGHGVEGTWKAALAGKSGTGTISLFDVKDCPVKIAAEVRGFDPTQPLTTSITGIAGREPLAQAVHPKDIKRFGRFTHLGVVAGIQAYLDSGLDRHRGSLNDELMGVNIGVGQGGLPEIQAVHDGYLAKGFRRIAPFFILQSITNIVSGQLSVLLSLKGPNHCNVTACATSAHSIGESARVIQRGEADVMLVGGAEAVICELGIGGFAAMKALSDLN